MTAPTDPEAEQDLVAVLAGFTNFIQNERVRAYNAGVDAERERCAKLVDDFPWILPMFDDKSMNEATDDAAESVREQIANAIREPV